MRISRRELLLEGLGMVASLGWLDANAEATSLHCTAAPTFPVPLTPGSWHSAAFPVAKHEYQVWLYVDRSLPLDRLDCDLGPARFGRLCDTLPLLEVEWKIKDGGTSIKTWVAKPVRADSWAAEETGCLLGGFHGTSNGMFTLDWDVSKDAGRLKELHPRIEIVKNPGYWCWL